MSLAPHPSMRKFIIIAASAAVLGTIGILVARRVRAWSRATARRAATDGESADVVVVTIEEPEIAIIAEIEPEPITQVSSETTGRYGR
jgi:hypothetical protein